MPARILGWLILLMAMWTGSAIAVPGSRFGVALLEAPGSASLQSDLDAIARIGIGWVRVRPDWSRMQPEPGAMNWSESDTLVRAAHAHGLSIVYTLGYTPRWASRYGGVAETDVWNKNAPRDDATWRRYVQSVVRRYANKVGYWQVWEQTAVYFFRGSDKDMREMARVATKVTHQVDARDDVVLPEAGQINLAAINRYYLWGAQAFFDELGLYPRFERPERMLRPLRTLQDAIVRKKGPLKDLWISSLGWDVQPSGGPYVRSVVSEEDQARFLVRGMALALANGVRRIFWEAWRDREGTYQESSHAGLLRADGTPRPALAAYGRLIDAIGERPPAGQAHWGPHLFGCLFADASRGVLVAWSDSTPARLALGAVRPQSVCDALGRRRDPDSSGQIRLDGDPVMVVGSRAALEALLTAPVQDVPAADPDFSTASAVSAVLGSSAIESGLYANVYRPVASHGVRVVEKDGQSAWETALASNRYEILFDVDDSFMYFVDGRYDVDVEVQVYGNTSGRPMGFNVGYDSMQGYAFTSWQWVEESAGWKTYRFHLRDACLADPYTDIRINALGSKADIAVHAVTVRRVPRTPASAARLP